MLAKDIKIKTILRQRTFIEEQLSKMQLSKDGNPSYRYAGHVYKENVVYFEAEGYAVTCVSTPEVLAQTGGCAIYVFVPNDVLIVLSEEEMKEAEKHILPEGLEEELKAMADRAKSAAGSFFDFIMNCSSEDNCGKEDDDEDSSEE